MKQPKPTLSKDSGVAIGYMGGQTHQADLEFVKNALLNVYRKYPDHVKYKFWVAQPPVELLELPSTEYIAINLEDYAQFAKYYSQQDCDIFIAPLGENKFNRAKSCVKFLEYSVLGVPGVFSNLPPYETVVEHGINGYLADSPDGWYTGLSAFIENPTLRNQIATAAQKTVQEEWLLSRKYHELIDVYQLALEEKGPAQKVRQDNANLKRIISQAEDYQSGLEERLHAVDNQLNEIHNSRSWRLLKQIQKLRLKLIPKG